MHNFATIASAKTNEELLAMVYEFDKWSPEMMEAIETALAERNILPGDIQLRKQELIKEEETVLSAGREASITGQVVGWLGIFGLLGLFMGYHYAFSKVRSRYTQKQYFEYNDDSRKIGRNILFTAVIIWTFIIFYKIS